MSEESITTALPLVWPEPRVSAGHASYADVMPLERALRAATSVFGVVSAIDDRAIESTLNNPQVVDLQYDFG